MDGRLPRLLLALGGLGVVLTGCDAPRSQLLRRNQDTQSTRPSEYDEYLGWESDLRSNPEHSSELKRMFKPSRRPGGLSPEARAIERESFNIF